METMIKVCEQSQDLLEILRQFDKAYNMFVEHMDKYYGENRGSNELEDKFYDRWCHVTSVVEEYLWSSMIYALRETHFTSI